MQIDVYSNERQRVHCVCTRGFCPRRVVFCRNFPLLSGILTLCPSLCGSLACNRLLGVRDRKQTESRRGLTAHPHFNLSHDIGVWARHLLHNQPLGEELTDARSPAGFPGWSDPTRLSHFPNKLQRMSPIDVCRHGGREGLLFSPPTAIHSFIKNSRNYSPRSFSFKKYTTIDGPKYFR